MAATSVGTTHKQTRSRTAAKSGSATRDMPKGSKAGTGAKVAAPATTEDAWLQELTDAITSVTTKTHSMQLYEMMGLKAHSKMRPYLFGVLSRVRELQPVRVSDVAQHMDYERSTVSRHVAELTELGCVERMAHPDDGRVVILRLTAKGQRMIDKVYDAWLTSLSEITSDWSVSDRKTFLRLLLRFDRSFTEFFAEDE